MATTHLGEDLEARILGLLRQAAGSDAVLRDPDLPLYASGLLDSLGTVTLMAALGEQLAVEVSPAEFDQEAWATPRRFVADVRRRLERRGG